MSRLRELEDADRRQQIMYVDERLQADIIQEACTIKLVYLALRVSLACYGNQACLPTENAELGKKLIQLICNWRNWVFGVCFMYRVSALTRDAL